MLDSTRRDFLETSGRFLGGAWLAANLPAIQVIAREAAVAAAAGAPLRALTQPEARVMEAMAMRIIPTDEMPGAKEANILHFFDQALTDFAANQLTDLRLELEAFASGIKSVHPTANDFSDLTVVEQDAVLRALEEERSSLFERVRNLTIVGTFGHPDHSANNGVGFKILGMDPAPAFQPPFGYYDAEYRATDGRR